MSSNHASAALTSALLANKGAAAPSNSVTSFLEAFPVEKQTSPDSVEAQASDHSMEPSNFAEIRRTYSDGADPIPAKGRVKLSVRLDPDRHLRLKLAAAHLRRSGQVIMLDALDAYLASVTPAIDTNCPCLNDDG